MKFGTKAVHAGVEPDPTTGAIMTPIYQTSTYVQASPGDHKGYEYSRTGNPTRNALENALENAIAELENGKYGACFGSGLAAIDCVMKMLKPHWENRLVTATMPFSKIRHQLRTFTIFVKQCYVS